MRGRKTRWMVLAIGCTTVIALGADWTWVDGGADHDWDTCGNWITYVDACYPCTSSDDPLIPDEPNDPNYPDGWIVNLIDVEELGDMTIYGTVQFGDADPNDANVPTIRPDSLSINATTSEDNILVTMDGGCIIVGSIEK
jgi:hypothetical protein